MKMTITELVEYVGQVFAEDKRAKKSKAKKKDGESKVGDALPHGYAYAEALDFMKPLGEDNRYHLQGQAAWGPSTGVGLSMNMNDNIVLNKNIFRFEEGKSFSPWDLLGEAVQPAAAPTLWESVLRWYDHQKLGLGLDEAAEMDEKHVGFKKLAQHFARQKNIHDPDALAASIGRKKYGAKGMAKKAAAGHK